jgi:phage gpG-like protein
MSAIITVQLSPGALELIEKFKGAPQQIPQAIKRGMDRSLEVVTGRIQEKRLSGIGPYPVEEHRLGQVTQQLWRSTRATPSTIESTGTQAVVAGKIGASVIYAAVHEFGFQGEVQVKTFQRKGRTVKAYTRRMNIRARAPFQTGITENLDYISGEIEKELVTTLKA